MPVHLHLQRIVVRFPLACIRGETRIRVCSRISIIDSWPVQVYTRLPLLQSLGPNVCLIQRPRQTHDSLFRSRTESGQVSELWKVTAPYTSQVTPQCRPAHFKSRIVGHPERPAAPPAAGTSRERAWGPARARNGLPGEGPCPALRVGAGPGVRPAGTGSGLSRQRDCP